MNTSCVEEQFKFGDVGVTFANSSVIFVWIPIAGFVAGESAVAVGDTERAVDELRACPSWKHRAAYFSEWHLYPDR